MSTDSAPREVLLTVSCGCVFDDEPALPPWREGDGTDCDEHGEVTVVAVEVCRG